MEMPKHLIKNKYGIGIVACCASCKFKKFVNMVRCCLLDGCDVPSGFVCGRWGMSPPLENVGKGGGKVKNSQYLHYAVEKLAEDNVFADEAAAAGLSYNKLTVEELREDYSRDNGTIYAIEE